MPFEAKIGRHIATQHTNRQKTLGIVRKTISNFQTHVLVAHRVIKYNQKSDLAMQDVKRPLIA